MFCLSEIEMTYSQLAGCQKLYRFTLCARDAMRCTGKSRPLLIVVLWFSECSVRAKGFFSQTAFVVINVSRFFAIPG